MLDFLISPAFLDGVATFGSLMGFAYIVLQYKAHPWFWYVSLFTAVPLTYVNAMSGNYATAILFFYYTVVTVQVLTEKFLARKKAATAQPTFIISNMPTRLWLPLALITLALTAAFYFGIDACKGFIPQDFWPKYPLLDASLTALSFVGMWVLKRNYIECWYFWIVVNAGYTGLYFLLGDMKLTATFAFWLVMAIMGVPKWNKLMTQQQANQTQ